VAYYGLSYYYSSLCSLYPICRTMALAEWKHRRSTNWVINARLLPILSLFARSRLIQHHYEGDYGYGSSVAST
jgi:hypothetical protein